MTSLEKAKRFIQKTACKTGLLIVPLAAATIAHAKPFQGPILPSGGATCSISDGGVSGGGCFAGAFNFSPLGAGSMAGVSLFTTSGGATFFSGGVASLELSASGTLQGGSIPSGTTIPLAYDFDLGFLNGELDASITGWTLDFQLLDGSTVIGDSGLISGSPDDPSSGQSFFGTSSMTTSLDALLYDSLTEQVVLNVTWNPGDSDGLSISVPGTTNSTIGSFDYDSTDIASVPEPGTLGLTGSVLGLGAFYLRRRKRQANS